MKYLSLFSGIEAASLAWRPLGWSAVAFAEIERFPCALLAHHYPGVPNLGDVTKITEADIAALGQIDLVVFGSPCFTAGHTVLTARGLLPIESVVVGDSVWTHASRWRRVSAVMKRVAPTVIVNGQGHNAIRATPDHPFYAADTIKTWNGKDCTRNLSEAQWVCADAMQGKRWATPINLACEAGTPDDLRSHDCAYLAGLYLGDGHIGRTSGRNKKSVILSVGASKRDNILPTLRDAWGVVSAIPHGPSVTRLQLSRTSVANALLREFGEYSHAKHIPVWALCADREWQEAFLQGILDTDGSAFGSGWRVTTVSRALAVGLRLLAARLGYSTSLRFDKRPTTCVIGGRTVNQRDTWTVALRKGNRTSELRTDDHVWGLVRSVTPAEESQVYDITVEDDHSFVCDGIVVHNCQDLSLAGKGKGLKNADGTPTRSGLFFTAINIIEWARKHCGCRFALWENVFGAFSSNKGRDFASVVEKMAGLRDVTVPANGWGNEGAAVGDFGLLEWGTLDAQFAGVAQRRRRVFALADFGDWANRPPIILEPHSLRGDHPPSREAGQEIAAGTLRSTDGGCDVDHARAGHLQPVVQSISLRGRDGGGTAELGGDLAGCLRASGGGGDKPHVLAPYHSTGAGYWQEGFGTLRARPQDSHENVAVCVTGDITHTLRAEGFDASEDGTGRGQPIVATVADTLTSSWHNSNGATAGNNGGMINPVIHGMAVRRLSVVECEKLQGLPPNYTNVPYRGKPAADGPRYKAIGNSFAVPVVAWIGRKIDAAIRNQDAT